MIKDILYIQYHILLNACDISVTRVHWDGKIHCWCIF